MSKLTVDQFRTALPTQMKKVVTPELMDSINGMMAAEPEIQEAYRDNLLSYTHVMRDGKFKMEQYLSAVRYVSHKIMGCLVWFGHHCHKAKKLLLVQCGRGKGR